MRYGSRESQVFTRLALVLMALMFARMPVLAQNDRARVKTYVPKLEKILNENIARFWLAKSLDGKNGGYVINFGPEGEPKGAGTKMIVSQARQVWLFSRMARGGYGDRQKNLAAADLGYRFLKDKMWDAKNGGFHWEVDATGDKKLKPKKHLYGQAFALYALSEYYLASRRQEVLEFARRFFDLLEAKSHDKEFGGYVEYFNEDWTQPPAGEASYMSVTRDFKLMNTHLHLLEALTTFYRASKSPLARERLVELINIESNSVVRKNLGACTDKYARNWEPQLNGEYARVSYGHDLENIWLLIDACDAAGISHYPLLDLYKTLFDYSLRHGYDDTRGGFYDTGAFNQSADKRNKIWWVQAEAIVSALYMYRLTNDAKYLSVFEKTFDFIEKYQVDWKHGEWHAVVTPEGKVEGDKAHAWKAGYHGGRAMIECAELLKRLE
ncbi:MAG: AGE family epimerase/isomerase [Acidobacteriota bacterium]|nr:AGE family epimerase/isomerase [Acidobacteriota bacterium]